MATQDFQNFNTRTGSSVVNRVSPALAQFGFVCDEPDKRGCSSLSLGVRTAAALHAARLTSLALRGCAGMRQCARW